MNAAVLEGFAAYIDAFNRDDYAAFGDYYTDDVVLVIAGVRELRGRQAIFDFYRDVKSKSRRTISIVQAFCDEKGLAAELKSEFLALDDLPDFPTAALRAGDRMRINTLALYEMTGGRFSRIRSATFQRQLIRAGAPTSEDATP